MLIQKIAQNIRIFTTIPLNLMPFNLHFEYYICFNIQNRNSTSENIIKYLENVKRNLI